MNPDVEIFYVNLLECLYQDYLILSDSNIINENESAIVQNPSDLSVKKKIYFLPSYNSYFLKNKNIDLFLNISSFQEMEPSILQQYFEIISSNKSILYHCNRVEKTLDDGSVVKIKDYPIGRGKIIFNEQCPWHSFYYLKYFKKAYFKGVNNNMGINHSLVDYRS